MPLQGKRFITIALSVHMEIRQELAKVEESAIFQEWRTEMPQAYLTNLFVLIDGTQKEWQVSYFDPESHQSTSFDIGSTITRIPPSPTFKEPDAVVHTLDVASVKLDLTECLTVAAEQQRSAFPTAFPNKIIAILQQLPIGTVYNITYVTAMLSTLNFKVDAHTGKILDAKLIPIMSFAPSENSR